MNPNARGFNPSTPRNDNGDAYYQQAGVYGNAHEFYGQPLPTMDSSVAYHQNPNSGTYFDPNAQLQYQQSYGNDLSYGTHGNLATAGSRHHHTATDQAAAWMSAEMEIGTDQEQVSSESMAIYPGFYFPSAPLAPQLYDTPVSAVAYDATYSAVYVASHTQNFGSGRVNQHRASMLVTHSTLDGMLYSSCAGHPEGKSSTLKQIYQTFFGLQSLPSLHSATPYPTRPGAVGGAAAAAAGVPPTHAYEPPYGKFIPPNHTTTFAPTICHMGITTLIPTSSGYVASISPAAVRLHASGGLCVETQPIEGMVCGTAHPTVSHNSTYVTHISAAGLALGSGNQGSNNPKPRSNVYTMDVHQNMKVVSSQCLQPSSHQQVDSSTFGVMSLRFNRIRHALVAGCSDGTIRILDSGLGRGRSAEVAKVKAQMGGVSNLAISDDGTLICSTGFSSRSSASAAVAYAFPDPHLLLYDIRYLGRGGIAHAFSGLRGGPRFVEFVPPMANMPAHRIVAASGQKAGGLQIIGPFEEPGTNAEGYIVPQMMHQAESITAMCIAEGTLALGTSHSQLLQYELAGYEPTIHSFPGNGGDFIPSATAPRNPPSWSAPSTGIDEGVLKDSETANREKIPLDIPSYVADPPPVSIDPRILLSNPDGAHVGVTDQTKSVFGAYILCAEPKLTPLGQDFSYRDSCFGPISNRPILNPPKRTVSAKALAQALPKREGDLGVTIPTANLNIDLLNENHNNFVPKEKKNHALLMNSNKLLYCEKLREIFYGSDARRKGRGKTTDGGSGINSWIPDRYRRTVREQYKSAANFDHAVFNKSGIFPGWDYPHTMPNSHVPSVVVLLYFVPEIRSAMLQANLDPRLTNPATVDKVSPITTELGLLFHHIESISQNALLYPGDGIDPQVGAFVPTSFLSEFITMPEAVSLALLDDNPAVVDKARRPEAFYRFILHQLDKESAVSQKKDDESLMDGLHGLDFTSINEFITGAGPPSASTNRALTVDLAYGPFVSPTHPKDPNLRFGEVLLHALCRETRLRAWCSPSQSYETIVQRKIARSLPTIMPLSCACAGMKEHDGLSIWRNQVKNGASWLPEMVEVEIDSEGNVIVSEAVEVGEGQSDWIVFRGKKMISESIRQESSIEPDKVRYRIDSVLSFIRDEKGKAHIQKEDSEKFDGHHVLHARVPSSYTQRLRTRQRDEVQNLLQDLEKSSDPVSPNEPLTLSSSLDPAVVNSRLENVNEALTSEDADDWVLFNGFVVTPTSSSDARDFRETYKDPCLIIFRAVDTVPPRQNEAPTYPEDQCPKIPDSVMQTRSLSSGAKPPKYPGKGIPDRSDIVSFDAEFVSVQGEESILTDSGQKITIQETRHALARISLLDCATKTVLVDDYIIPREPVVDYLTRFSGIVPSDLDPKKTPHHLIHPRSAYLKLRHLLERGCVFLGHGLSQDFLTANLCVPPTQIIDTVHIYHKPGMRYISLRFLTNYVLKRDMQEDVHDSVEDAKAAFELYQFAVMLKKRSRVDFDRFLDELYDHGQRTDWKLRVDP